MTMQDAVNFFLTGLLWLVRWHAARFLRGWLCCAVVMGLDLSLGSAQDKNLLLIKVVSEKNEAHL